MGIINDLQQSLRFKERHKHEFADMDDYRVAWSPNPVRPGETVMIDYRGLLKDSGADEVYLHYGFDGWKDQRTIKMDRQFDGCFAAGVAGEGKEIDFCFKDSAANWDNNSGWNWSLSLR